MRAVPLLLRRAHAVAVLAASIPALGLAAAAPSAAAAPVVALLPLAATRPDLPDAPLPNEADLSALTTGVRRSIEAAHVPLLSEQRVGDAVRAAGFDQADVLRSCVTADCAARVAKSAGASIAVYGTVARALGVHWNAHYTVVAVPSGKELGEYDQSVVGDARSLEADAPTAGACIARIIRHVQPPCGDTGDFGV